MQGKKGTGKQVLPVVQEEVAISRETKKTGKAVRVRIESHDERKTVPVFETLDEVSVERVPINRYVDERTEPREEGDVVIIPVYETVSVVERRILLREEVRIVRRRREVRRDEEVTLRKETPVIERRSFNPASIKESAMIKTIIGIFETPDSAYAAGDALVDQGVDESSIYFSAKEGSADSGLKGQPMNAIRNFLSEIFGPESSEDADAYADEIERGAVLLSVDVTEDSDLETICDTIEEAGVLDMKIPQDMEE